MSFLDTIESAFVTTEKRVQTIITDILKGGQVLEADIHTASSWIVGKAPTIASDLQGVLAFLTEVEAVVPGVGANAEVKAAVSAANLAVQGINAFATEYSTTGSTAQGVLSGYAATQSATSALAAAKAAVASSPTA